MTEEIEVIVVREIRQQFAVRVQPEPGATPEQIAVDLVERGEAMDDQRANVVFRTYPLCSAPLPSERTLSDTAIDATPRGES